MENRNQFTTAHVENDVYELDSLVRSPMKHFCFKHNIYISTVTILFIKSVSNKR